MPRSSLVSGPDAFTTFGELLHYLRRRARLKQRDLAIASGYSEAQISRLEQNQRVPDPITLSALIIPALDLDNEPELAARLLRLAMAARTRATPQAAVASSPAPPAAPSTSPAPVIHLNPIPVPAPGEIPRPIELARLRSRLLMNRHVALCGMAGVGKTTLAAALAREHALHHPVFWLTLHSQVTTFIDTMIVQLAEFLHSHGQTAVAPLLSAEPAGALLPLERRMTLICAGFAQLDAQAAPLICIDNMYLVQYAQPIQQLLGDLMTTTSTAIVLISRETVPLTGFTQLVLRGMAAVESEALISRLGAGVLPLTPAAIARLHAKVDGNPMLLRLAIGQVFDHLADPEGFIANLETTPQITAYVLETIRQRLAPDTWRLGALLAVIREPVNLYDEVVLDLWADMERAGDLATATADLQRHLLITDPQAAVLPPLLRDQISAALLPDPVLRRQLHRLAARWATQAQGDPLQAVYHYARADALAEASAILSRQIDRLHAQGQALAAVRLVDELLARARRAGGAVQPISRLLLSRAELLTHTLRTAEAEADYRAALAAADTPALQALVGIKLAHYLALHGRPEQALRECAAAQARLGPHDTLLQLELAVGEAGAYSTMARYDEALRVATAALPLAEGAAAGALRATLYAQIGMAHYAQRRIPEAREYVQRAIALAEQEYQQRAADRYRVVLGHVLLTGGDPGGALRLFDAVVPAVQAAGDILTLEYLLGLQMVGRFLRADYAGAGDALDAALALRHTLGVFPDRSTGESHFPYVLIGLGRLGEARELLNHLLDQPAALGAERALGYNLCRRAMLELLSGAVSAAQHTLRTVLELPVTTADPRLNAEAETLFAAALLVGGLPVRAARMVAAEPPLTAGAWARLERMGVRALIHAALDDTATAKRLLTDMSIYAVTTGHLHYQAVAVRLEEAIEAPLVPAELSQLIYGEGRGRA